MVSNKATKELLVKNLIKNRVVSLSCTANKWENTYIHSAFVERNQAQTKTKSKSTTIVIIVINSFIRSQEAKKKEKSLCTERTDHKLEIVKKVSNV